VVLAEYRGKGSQQEFAVGAFVMPNIEIQGKVPLSTWLVPISDLEAAAGLSFFNTFLTEQRRNALATHEHAVWEHMGRPASSSILAVPDPSLPKITGKASKKVIGTAPSQGLLHLCEFTACELVSEDWAKRFNNSKGDINPVAEIAMDD
ncbi:hypothetical protein CYMTET_6344, partial [Cymbomonas tetramitiformis]